MGLTEENMSRKAIERGMDFGRDQGEPLVALMGNPNVGKSTIFNCLTKMNQHTGNWPGKTVSIASGQFTYKGKLYRITDLPGTYSLLGRSAEEEVAVDFLRYGKAECVVIVCDATCLERNLIQVLQVMELTDRIIVCVNLLDEAEKKHIEIDLSRLERELGVPVIGTSASNGTGVEKLQSTVRQMVEGFCVCRPKRVSEMEEDASLHSMCKERHLWEADAAAPLFVHRAEQLAAMVSNGAGGYTAREARIDRILTGRRTALPILFAMLLVVFWITIVGANYPSSMLQTLFDWIGGWMRKAAVAASLPWWLQGVLLDGIWATVARVVAVMLPPMAIFFPLFTLLEDLGFLPRIAYVLDHRFSKCGACGKQALSMCMGFGCNAAGVIGCRIIDSARERLIAILTNALVPCNGRFPALIMLITIFLSQHHGAPMTALLLAGFVVLSVVVTFAASWLLHKTVLRGTPTSFVLELPPFRKPKVGEVLVRSFLDRTFFVLKRAVLVAAPAGFVLWCVSNIAVGDTTLMLWLAGILEPMGRIMGMSGVVLLAFILGFPANELILPIILMILGGGTVISGEVGHDAARTILMQAGWGRETALCTILFFLFHWPCSTTCLTIYKETRSLKWTLWSIFLPTAVGVLLCVGVHLLI